MSPEDSTFSVLRRSPDRRNPSAQTISMSDYVNIDDLQLRTIIGINPDERVNLQDIFVSIRLQTDTRAAGTSDDIADAVNYRTLTKEVIDLVESTQYFLVEKLAEEIARVCLQDERVARVSVRLRKPGALRFARSVGVTIERSRSDF